MLIVLWGGLFYTQILKGEYYSDLSENNRIRLQKIEAPRGRILDRNNQVLAGNRPSYNLFIVPRDFNRTYASWLESLLSLEAGSLEEKLKSKQVSPYLPYLLKQDISKEEVFKIQEKKPDLTGVMIAIGGRRLYPHSNQTAHLTGYIGKVSKKEYEEGKGKYDLNDFIGRAGVEMMFDDQLRGEDGGRQVEVNSRGEVIRVLGERPAKTGQDITLSIDHDLQGIIWSVVDDYDEDIVIGILDLETGRMVAMVSKPSYDPNIFVTGGKDKERLSILKDKSKPMLDRLIAGSYPPGSVFKLITAASGLESGKITPHTIYYCAPTFTLGRDQHVFKDWNPYGFGNIKLHTAIARSSNVFFYKLGNVLGVELISEAARRFKLDQKPEVELPGVSAGLIPDSAWKKERFGERWYRGDTISYAIGQGYVTLSPLQILKMTATLAKDGYSPRLTILEDEKQDEEKIDLDRNHIRVIKRAMRDVVETDSGTGKHARVPFAEIAAKTGTAQNPHGKTHAWLTGFFPYQKPRYAIVCLVEHGGAGGQVAGTLTREVLTAWQNKKGIDLV